MGSVSQIKKADERPPEFPQRVYVIPPDDWKHGWPRALLAYRMLREAVRWARAYGMSIEVVIRLYLPGRSSAQQRTMWKWHGQVASELTIRTGKRWFKEDVHEIIFLARWMPLREMIVPDTGEIRSRPYRTSDKTGPEEDPRSMREIISEAMDEYLVWIYDEGIQVTVPERREW